jgi:hypothetical protein
MQDDIIDDYIVSSQSQETDPKTRAIEAYIEASVEVVLGGPGDSPQDGLLFLSSWHEAMPAVVFLDPVLETNDKVVFAVLWIWGRQQGRSAMAFPTYAYLMKRCGIQSRSTLSRCLAILRITRWITLCRRVRSPQGQNRGNIYALHEEPLTLSATLHLDPEYMGFVQKAEQGHHHDRVRRVARTMLDSIRGRIAEGETVTDDSTVSQIDRRVEALDYLDSPESSKATTGYFSFLPEALNALRSPRQAVPERVPDEPSDPVRLSNSGPGDTGVRLSNCKKSNSVCSSYIYKKTTTTNTDPELKHQGELSTGPTPQTFIFPDTLSENERNLAELYLTQVPEDLRQPLLDELAGQIRARKDSSRPIRNKIGFFSWLCNEAAGGNIHLTSVSLQVRDRRERETRIARHEQAKTRELTEQAKERLKAMRETCKDG